MVFELPPRAKLYAALCATESKTEETPALAEFTIQALTNSK